MSLSRPFVRSTFRLALLSALVPLALAGCQSGETTSNSAAASAPTSGSAKRYKIGFANLTEDIPFAVRVREGIQEYAKKAGNIDLVLLDNKLDGATALSNADTMITKGVQGVIEFQTDEKFGKSIMAKMKANNIPVVAIDIPMPGASFFGVNNPVAGRLAGEGLGKWIKANWGGKIDALIMLELPQSGEVPAARMKGQRDGLETVIGKIPEEKVKHLDSKNTLEEARRLVTDSLSTLPNAKHIAIVCINDDTAAGAIVAAEAAGRKDQIAVTAVDGSERGRQQIRKAGSPHVGSAAAFPEKYGQRVLPILVKAIDGEKLPEKFYTEHVFLNKENVDKYYPNDKK